MASKRSGRELLEDYCACSVIPLEPGLSSRELLAAIEDEVELEREARMSEPFICVDTNNLSHALYVGESELVPLGVAIRRHFGTFSDFLWIERTTYGGEQGEAWSAVIVQDGLALDELLNVPKSEIRRMLADISKPISVITRHRHLLESWLPKALRSGTKLSWIEITVSPLQAASHQAMLEYPDKALKTAKLVSPVNPKHLIWGGVAAAALLVGLLIFGTSSEQAAPIVAPLDPNALKERAQRRWIDDIAKMPPVSASLRRIYDLTLEGWAVGLNVTGVKVDKNSVTLLFRNGRLTQGEALLARKWAEYRGLTLNKNSLTGPLTSRTFLPGENHFLASTSDALFFSDEILEEFKDLYNIKNVSLRERPAPLVTRSASVREIGFAVSLPDNLLGLHVLAADPLLRDTFLESLELSLNPNDWRAGGLNMRIGAWTQPPLEG